MSGDDDCEMKPGISRRPTRVWHLKREAAEWHRKGGAWQHRTRRGGEVAELAAVESRALFGLIKVQSALQMALANPRTGEQRRCDVHFFCAMEAIFLAGRDVVVA